MSDCFLFFEQNILLPVIEVFAFFFFAPLLPEPLKKTRKSERILFLTARRYFVQRERYKKKWLWDVQSFIFLNIGQPKLPIDQVPVGRFIGVCMHIPRAFLLVTFFRQSSCLLTAAHVHVITSHAHPFLRAYFRQSSFSLYDAFAHVCTSHGHPYS